MTNDLINEQQQPVVPGGLVQGEYRKIPRLLELILALVAVALASVLCIWMIFYPATAEPRIARFFLCTVIALYLSVFFFILWPQPDLEAEVRSWFASKPVKVVGPVVLFFITLGILYGLVPPREEFAKIYPVIPPADHPILFDPVNTTIKSVQPSGDIFARLISGTGNETDQLKDIYIKFPPGEDTIGFVFKHHSFDDFESTLNRGDSAIDLRQMNKTSSELTISPNGAELSGEYLFAASTLAGFRKELGEGENVKYGLLKDLIVPGSKLAAMYVKVRLLDDGQQVEIELYYSMQSHAKLQPLLKQFRSTDEDDKDFKELIRAIAKSMNS